jgi:hypothetical protein
MATVTVNAADITHYYLTGFLAFASCHTILPYSPDRIGTLILIPSATASLITFSLLHTRYC